MEQLKRISEADYLRMEESAKTKHEFRGGKIVDMAGGTEPHAGIASNLIFSLKGALKGKPCKAYGSDLKVRISESGDYCYPDVSVVCGGPEFHNPQSRVAVSNPRLIIEVTSPSSEADDRGDKFTGYRAIQSLEEYMLVSQQRAQVETFYRQSDGIWAIGPTVMGMDRTVQFRSLEIDISMKEIYDDIQFPTKSAEVAEPEMPR
jgi:Uma2 family endonuclease